MPGIVCPIRGGPSSQPTIDRGIALAQETLLPLFFLYVVNLDFLSHTMSSRVRFLSQEMERMGEFILLQAQTKAQAEGVRAHAQVRHGIVREEIIALAQEIEAGYVVLGLPRGEQVKDVFTSERFEELCRCLEEESGAQVILTDGLQE